MGQIVIKGNKTRGNKVIEILEMLGGKNKYNHKGMDEHYIYYVNDIGNICRILEEHLSSDDILFTLEEFIEKYPYKIGDEVILEYDNQAYAISDMIWNGEDVLYITSNAYEVYANELKPYKEETMEKEMSGAIIDRFIRLEGYEFCDDKGNVLNTKEITMKKKQPQYPKTYEECCKVLMGKTDFQDFTLCLTKLCTTNKMDNVISPEPPHIKEINALYILLICRDAYWKLAGWKVEWGNTKQEKYGRICQRILVFPTEEMYDIFYENFKDLIEECKELL